MFKTCGNWLNIIKNETRKYWVILLASHFFFAPPPSSGGKINFPATHPTSLTVRRRQCGGRDGGAAAVVVGGIVPRK